MSDNEILRRRTGAPIHLADDAAAALSWIKVVATTAFETRSSATAEIARDAAVGAHSL